MFLIGAANFACTNGSTGRCLILVLAGSFPRKLSPFQFVDGRTGLGTKPPPQFGHTLPRMPSTHAAQNVHSYEQMRASSEFGGRALLQCSQVGRSSSIVSPHERSSKEQAGMFLTVRDARRQVHAQASVFTS